MSATPQISVVVSTHNRAERLARMLESLRAQTVDRSDFEVVVVDDGSTDGTAEVIAREIERGELPLTQIARESSGGPAAGRNEGWRRARAPVVAFTDDDCETDPAWLEELLAAAAASPGAFVQGRTDPIPAELPDAGVFSRTIEMTELTPFFNTCNIAYPRELLGRPDGFDERTYGRHPGGEDTDLGWRAIELGAEPVFAYRARVFHAVNQLGAIGGLRLALRWSDTMAVFARHPGMRDLLYRRVFWKRSHALLARALLGAALARRFPPAALLAYPYARDVVRRTRRAGSPAAHAPYLALQDLLELFAAVRGGIRHGYFVV